MKLPNNRILSKILIILLFSMLIPIMISSNSVAQLDSDGDGLLDSEEIKYHTDQFDADSDDDGVLDGDEKDWNKNTDGKGDINALDHDSDDDGIYDGTEMGITKNMLHNDTNLNSNHFREDADPSTTTDMTKWDTDGDHLSDGEEDKNRNGKYDIDINETDPNYADRDGDGVEDSEDPDIDNDGMYNDFEELYDFDPYDPSDAKDDYDGDGYTNLREYLGDDNNPGNNDWSDPTNPLDWMDLPPVVKFSRDEITNEANQTIIFDVRNFNVTDSQEDFTAGVKYTWTFGDGVVEGPERVYKPLEYKKRHEYITPGDYTLTLKAEDVHGNTDEDTIKIIIRVPVGITDTTINIEQEKEEYNDKKIIRRNGWVAYKIEDVRVNEKITIEYEVLDPDEEVGVRIFIIPAKNFDVYKDNQPGVRQISRKYDEYWEGHLTSIARKGKIEFEAQEEDDIIVIFDNGYYDEYKKTVVKDKPVEYKVKITREESPLFLILGVFILIVVLVGIIIGLYFIIRLRQTKGMTKFTREAAIETQRSLDREMAQLELEIQDSLSRRSAQNRPMGAVPMSMQQQRMQAPPQQRQLPPQQAAPAQTAAPGTVPKTPGTAGAGVGTGTQVPGATPLPAGSPAQARPSAQAQTQGTGTQQMLPPAAQGQRPVPGQVQPQTNTQTQVPRPGNV